MKFKLSLTASQQIMETIVAKPVNDPISKVYKMSESMTLLRLSDLERLMYNSTNRLTVMITSTAYERLRPREKSHRNSLLNLVNVPKRIISALVEQAEQRRQIASTTIGMQSQ